VFLAIVVRDFPGNWNTITLVSEVRFLHYHEIISSGVEHKAKVRGSNPRQIRDLIAVVSARLLIEVIKRETLKNSQAFTKSFVKHRDLGFEVCGYRLERAYPCTLTYLYRNKASLEL
jgi:hypothetical protein